MDLIITPGGALQGEWIVPGDKSITHRAILLGAIAEGDTTIRGFLPGEDCWATVKALQACGVTFFHNEETLVVKGQGLDGLQPSSHVIDCQNSGTTLRLLAGLLSGQSFSTTLTGDSSLVKRPMKRIMEPLTTMGAKITGYPPLTITGGATLQGINYTLPIPSAQVKSCLLLAGLYAQSPTQIIEPIPTRDHTERMLSRFGATILRTENAIELIPGESLVGQSLIIPSDFSSAAFFIVGACLAQGSHILLRDVGVNPTRTGLLSILKEMGAMIHLQDAREVSGECVADIEVKSASLQGIEIEPHRIVSMIDECPILFIAAACAKGTTRIKGLKELRVKETDRLAVMANSLRQCGITVFEEEEAITIEGGHIQGGVIDSEGDHRIAMAMAIAGMVSSHPITVKNCDNIATSFPGFVELATQCGLTLEEVEHEDTRSHHYR